MDVVRSSTNAITNASAIVFEDEPVRFSNFASALGGVETPALKLFTGREMPASVAASGVQTSNLQTGLVVLRLDRGHVTLVTKPEMP
jgi:hypothetical protein